jgi:branched-chain amino acid aminotransferase
MTLTAPAAASSRPQRTSRPVPKIWIDGQYYEKDEAKISVFDHGLLYGDGVFEGIRAYNGKVFRLPQHVARLYASAHAILLEIPMAQEAMAAMVEDCVRVNGLTDAYIRLVVTRGFGDLGLDPRKCPKPTVFCIADTIALWPKEVYERGLSLITVPTPVNAPHNLSPQIKSLNYLAHIMAKCEAINANADDGILLDAAGTVAEATGQNLFVVTGRTLRTPPESAGILRGITRAAIMDLGREMGLEVRETVINRYDIYTADEAFLSGTAAEIVGVVKLDGRTVGNGSVGQVTKELATRFKEMAQRGG